MKNDYKN